MIDYSCSECGATYVKLWRCYQGVGDLLCQAHTEEDQDRTRKPGSYTIGWRVPAIPDTSGEMFWGYSSVPQDRVVWWDCLRDQKEKTT